MEATKFLLLVPTPLSWFPPTQPLPSSIPPFENGPAPIPPHLGRSPGLPKTKSTSILAAKFNMSFNYPPLALVPRARWRSHPSPPLLAESREEFAVGRGRGAGGGRQSTAHHACTPPSDVERQSYIVTRGSVLLFYRIFQSAWQSVGSY